MVLQSAESQRPVAATFRATGGALSSTLPRRKYAMLKHHDVRAGRASVDRVVSVPRV